MWLKLRINWVCDNLCNPWKWDMLSFCCTSFKQYQLLVKICNLKYIFFDTVLYCLFIIIWNLNTHTHKNLKLCIKLFWLSNLCMLDWKPFLSDSICPDEQLAYNTSIIRLPSSIFTPFGRLCKACFSFIRGNLKCVKICST